MSENFEKAKQLVNDSAEFIKNIKLEEGKTPENGAIIFKFKQGNLLQPILLGSVNIPKAKIALDFIIEDHQRIEKINQMPDDVRTAIGLNPTASK